MAVFLRFLHQASLLVSCLVCSCLENTYAKEPGEGQHSHSHIVSVSSLLPSTVCNRSRKVSSKDSLELVHKHGPCSELNQGKAKTLSWSEILLKDQARVRSINFKRRYMNSDGNRFEQTKSKNLPFGYDLAIGGGEFYAKIDIGTPGQSNYVILDTGSDITWIQCKPCAQCFKQPGPIFDPSKSSSHTTLPCNSSKCNLLSVSRPPHPRGCVSNECLYGSGYVDDFSSTGYLTFGKPDDLNNKYIKFTPIPTTPQQSQFYDIVITGISVAGKKLAIKSSVFAEGGAVVDSGTTITRLPPEAYAAMRSAYRQEMARYKFIGADENTDTCYDFSSYKTFVIPKVPFYFEGGVELEVDVKGIMLANDVKTVCLVFTAADDGDGAVLGNIMQRSIQVVRDVEGRRVGFGPETSYAQEPGEGHHSHSHIVPVSSLLPSTVCNCSRKVSSKGYLELVHIHGPCSELNQGKAKTPSLSEILLRDQARVQSINSRRYMNSDGNYRFKQTKSTTLPFGYDYSIGGANFYAKIDIGTPGQSNYVMLDTGSDITWIQCKPCAHCFKQPIPIFDPSKSSSHTTLPCNSSKCNLLSVSRPPHLRGCVSNKCLYRSGYLDGSFSKGYFVQDKLTFPTANRKSKVVVNNYLFGCGVNNSDANSESSIGLMGLSRAPISFVYQTAPLFKKYFSYCLPSDFSSTGYLTFGKPDDLNNKYIKFTPIPTTPQQSQFYDVIITGISVAGKKLPIKSSVYADGGAVVDSGTAVTRLQPEAYGALRSAFRKEMALYKFIGEVENIDTCYDFSSYETVVIPKVSFYFEGGAELEVDVKGIMLAEDVKTVCLAFTAADDGNGAILGNLMQRTVQVVYDVEGRRVGFGPGTCA
ncbi:hypothetical protein LWI28_002891 [Acer negundo]|uniref:Peptidase A1 domain-containing protein n=1 Tax=Acer negundo TaxID=4023 RepID=A0AAD5J944_ACENE|nr:hypothetical protein LWI28_002891 [Acer negundo]